MTLSEKLNLRAETIAEKVWTAVLDAVSRDGAEPVIPAIVGIVLPELRRAAGLPEDGRSVELTLKEWFHRESGRTGRSVNNVQSDFYRGKYPGLKLRRENARKVFVQL